MGKCVIFCAAEFDTLAEPIQSGDYIIAADGGLRHTAALGFQPDAILGDFDSLGYTPADACVFPAEKDDTDAMLAIRHGLALGYREFLLYGSLDGPRLDHTIANLQALQYLCDHDASGYLVGKSCLVTAVRDGALLFPPGLTGTISVFCLGSNATGVTLDGLYYPLKDWTLTPGFPLGVSNHFTGRAASVAVKRGTLVVLWDRKNGFPVRKQHYES